MAYDSADEKERNGKQIPGPFWRSRRVLSGCCLGGVVCSLLEGRFESLTRLILHPNCRPGPGFCFLLRGDGGPTAYGSFRAVWVVVSACCTLSRPLNTLELGAAANWHQRHVSREW
jgi:hypothetical protein